MLCIQIPPLGLPGTGSHLQPEQRSPGAGWAGLEVQEAGCPAGVGPGVQVALTRYGWMVLWAGDHVQYPAFVLNTVFAPTVEGVGLFAPSCPKFAPTEDSRSNF